MVPSRKNAILREAINESLSSLGEPIKNTVVWHLNLNGIFIESDQLEITSFYEHLTNIMGNGAEGVLDMIYEILSRNGVSAARARQDRSTLESIQDIIKSNIEGEASAQ